MPKKKIKTTAKKRKAPEIVNVYEVIESPTGRVMETFNTREEAFDMAQRNEEREVVEKTVKK